MTVKQRLGRSNITMFLIPLLIAALLLVLGAGIALYILETTYLPQIGMSLRELHVTAEQMGGSVRAEQSDMGGLAIIIKLRRSDCNA